MITLLTRTKRGKQPKQFGFMCKKCFGRMCRELGLDIHNIEEFAESMNIEQNDKG